MFSVFRGDKMVVGVSGKGSGRWDRVGAAL